MSTRLSKGIYWDRSWNPFTGCTPVGGGCRNCWAKRTAETRLRGRCGYPADEPFRPTFHPERLSQVNSKQKPRVIALCFMSDPFHEAHQIVSMFHTIVDCPQHTFIALTKRYDRMQDFLYNYTNLWLDGKPIPNLIGGVSIWDQPSADRMIPILLETNLATRIVSLEPCLGMVNLAQIPIYDECGDEEALLFPLAGEQIFEGLNEPLPLKSGGINGVILGGESGPGARPMHPDWARSVRDQCQAANVPFFFKQQGEWEIGEGVDRIKYPWAWVYPDGTLGEHRGHDNSGAHLMVRVGKKAAGRLLDGREWNELPK